MGWNDYHLYKFRCGDFVHDAKDLDYDDGNRNEAEVMLAEIALSVKARYTFESNFGDGWEHSVVVKAINAGSDAETPFCTSGERAFPPKDCYGAPRSSEFLRVLCDLARDDFAAVRRWSARDLLLIDSIALP